MTAEDKLFVSVYDVRNLPSRSAVTVSPSCLVNVKTPSEVLKEAEVSSVFKADVADALAALAEALAALAEALAAFACPVTSCRKELSDESPEPPTPLNIAMKHSYS